MSDPTTPDVPVEPTPQRRGRSSWGAAGAFVQRNLAPNRIAVFLTALIALCTALSPLFVDYSLPGVAAVLGAVAAFAAVIVKWLSGWQQYEKALQANALEQAAHVRQLEAMGAMQPPKGSAAARALGLPR